MTLAKFDADRSIATLTIAELEQFIQTTIQSHLNHLILPTRELDTPFDPTAPSFGAIATQHATQVPDEIWQTVPDDASENMDRYLYH